MYFCVERNLYTMKRIAYLLLPLAVLSCEKSIEESARLLFVQAEELYAAGEYNGARVLIDSLSVTYPKAYRTRRDAELLRREVLLKEKQRDVEYFVALCEELEAKSDSVTAGFVFNKDAQYQDMGYYTLPSQSISLNPFNSFLRASVKENGEACLTSFYRGAKISHKRIKVSAGDSFAESPEPFSSRSYRYLGVYNERRDYLYGSDGGIMDYIASSALPVKVELFGDNGNYSYQLRAEDASAIARVVELSNLLKSLEQARSLRDEAQRSLDFLMKSRQRSH